MNDSIVFSFCRTCIFTRSQSHIYLELHCNSIHTHVMYFHHLCVVALSLLLQSTTARRLSLPDKAYYVKPKGSLFTKRSAQEVISKLGLISNPEKGSYIQTFGRLREVQQPLCQHRNLLPPRERRSIYLAPCS